MTFDDYQVACHKTAIYPKERALEYLTLGLVGEAGELANKVKKIFRDDGGKVSGEKADQLCLEIGDCLWYCAELATFLDVSLEHITAFNIAKLAQRKHANTLKGSGDNR